MDIKGSIDWLFAEVTSETNKLAHDVADYSKKSTPIKSGKLANGFKVTEAKVEDKKAFVENSVPYAIHIELGTAKIKGKHMMSRGADQALGGSQ